MRMPLAPGWVSLVLLLGWTATGCKSPQKAGNDSLAAVQIKGHSFLEVARTTSEVFQKAGFQAVPLPPNRDRKMQFDKEGGTGDFLLYGDWSGEKIWYRAKIQFTTLDADTQLVTCDAYRVLERGSAHFEEEHKLSWIKRGGYQKLLDEVKARLEGGESGG